MRGHCEGRLIVVGIGPGSKEYLTFRAYEAIKGCNVIVGYHAYLKLLKNYIQDVLSNKEIISSGMGQELYRARKAIEKTLEGNVVCLISSGDPGIYGMAGVVLELLKDEGIEKIPIEIIPGVTAASACAGLLGAPLMNDFAVISLSDILTDPALIERRIRSACEGDFVIVFYNPKSKRRAEPLKKAYKILLEYRSPLTPVGIVRNAKKDDEEVILTHLENLLSVDKIDMGTTVIVGNSKTFVAGRYIITPRGYEKKKL